MDKTITLNGQTFKVVTLNGAPWYVELTLPSGFIRTIWHRDNNRPMSALVRRVTAA